MKDKREEEEVSDVWLWVILYFYMHESVLQGMEDFSMQWVEQ